MTTPSSLNNEEENNPSSANHTIGELIAQRTEDIKKIVAYQNQQQAIEYPVVTKLEPNYSEEVKKQIEKLSIEELKIKCQHFSKLFQVNKTNANIPTVQNGVNPNQNVLNRSNNNHKPYSSQTRPVYIPPKTTFKPKYFTTPKPNGFYITQGTTQKPTIHTQKTPIKYIRLEPVILQKTILSDGRTVYYWHRSLPTAVEVASDTTQNNQLSTSTDQTYPSYNNYYGPPPVYNNYNNIPYAYGNSPYRYAPWSQNYAPNTYAAAYQNPYTSTEESSEKQKSTEATTESSTTSTTEQTSYGYGFGSFLPFYGYRQEETTTTTTDATTTTTTTPQPTTEKLKPNNLLYAQQLKFIIPVPYEDLNGGTSISARNPWELDQYAYYPKELQPSTVNVQVPYNPTFHMIRAVALPSSIGKVSDEINL